MFCRRPPSARVRGSAAALTTPSIISLLVLAYTVAPATGDCTTVVLSSDESLVHGRNMDYPYEHGLILVNKRDVIKTAFIPPELGDTKSAKWSSIYGSVTISCLGREFPSSGVNEVGLTVSEMTLSESRYPQPDERGAINAIQWIQYQLDNFATVEEVLASDDAVRIFKPGKRGHHYLVSDASGDCATVEYLSGQVVAHRGAALPIKVLTNDTYEASDAFLRKHSGFGGSASIPRDRSSLARFVRAAELVQAYDQSAKPVDYAFQVLGAVAQGQSTKWSLVFDVKGSRFFFRTLSRPAVKSINLRQLDFGCATPMKMLDMKVSGQGNVTDKLKSYTDKAHEEFMLMVLDENQEIRQVVGDPKTFVAGMTRYYATLKCQ